MEELSSLEGVARIWKQEELHAGPFQELAPDLSIEWSGNSDGIVLGAGPAMKPGTLSRIPLSGVTPLLLYALGLHVPADVEGRIPAEILDPAWMEQHPAVSAASGGQREAEQPLIDPKDEEEILRRLRGLGYLE